jgi:hypothetical protein
MSAQMAMLSEKYDQAERMARECVRRNGANRECASVLAAAVESQR